MAIQNFINVQREQSVRGGHKSPEDYYKAQGYPDPEVRPTFGSHLNFFFIRIQIHPYNFFYLHAIFARYGSSFWRCGIEYEKVKNIRKKSCIIDRNWIFRYEIL